MEHKETIPSAVQVAYEYATFSEMLRTKCKSDEQVWLAIQKRSQSQPVHDRHAAYLMGCWCEKVDDNMKEALSHYQTAADMGHGLAQFTMGHLNMMGQIEGVRNLQAAVRWWVKATKDHDTADAWFTLGCVVSQGYDIHAYPELDSPVEFWIRAAKQGHGPAQKRLRACKTLTDEMRAALEVPVDTEKHVLV